MDPVRLAELLPVLRADLVGCAGTELVRRVTIDSREIRPGDLFWSLRGERHDGHTFAPQAIASGAIAAVVDRQHANQIAGPRLVVENTQTALAHLAGWYRKQSEALVIGVTGSVGKTTTRELIYSVLSVRHPGLRSRKNYNNEIGLPLSLLDLASEHEFAALELGAGKIGDIRSLCEIALPEAGVITRIGPAHLQSFGSLDAIYQAKGELLEALPCHGFAIVAGDDPRMRDMAGRAGCSTTFIGEGSENQLRAVDIDFQPGRLKFTVDLQRYELAAPARHYLTSALAALAVAREIGMEQADIVEGFQSFVGAPSRCQVESLGSWTLIDDSYNASPLAMEAACDCLRTWPTSGQRVLVCGDMLELGAESPHWHSELGARVARSGIDRLLTYGEHAHHTARGARSAGLPIHQIAAFREFEPLLAILDCWLADGDVVLVKGSRGMRMERVVEWMRSHADQKSGPQAPIRNAA